MVEEGDASFDLEQEYKAKIVAKAAKRSNRPFLILLVEAVRSTAWAESLGWFCCSSEWF